MHVHAALAKRVDIFRCSLSGVPSDRLLEVPAWMFDRAVSGYWRSLPVPHVDLSSLYALAKLLEDAEASSQSAVTGAALVSHETSRRDVHASPVHDIPVRSVLGPSAGEDGRDYSAAMRPEKSSVLLDVHVGISGEFYFGTSGENSRGIDMSR